MKTIGWLSPRLEEPDDRFKAAKRASLQIANSKVSKAIISSAFCIPATKVIISGSPRIDLLTRKNYHEQTEQFVNHLIMSSTSGKHPYCVWAPTYRPSYLPSVWAFLSDQEWEKLDKAVESLGMRLIVKPHYFDVHSLSRILRHRKNILLLTDDELNKQGLDFYDILKGSELLITDYSSVYIDYLVTTKPIIFFVPDLEDYLEKNTVCLEPFEEWTPGPKVKTVEEMSSNSFKALKGIAMGYQKKNRLVSAGIFCCRSFSRIP